ncbi:geminin coiled-coil domain-containing protein 1 [Rhinoraja longicauda]
MMSTLLSSQDQFFIGDQNYGRSPSLPSSASVDVSMETWYSQWPDGILDNSALAARPQEYFSSLDTTAQDDLRWTAHLSSQLHQNKQLQESLEQKEEELARLHEENNKLREYLSSTYVKSLKDKARKLLTHNGQKERGIFKVKKRLFEGQEDGDIYSTAPSNFSKRFRRNLGCSNESGPDTAREEHCSPCLDTWVLKTLGLKDANTIDDSCSANYSAINIETSPGYNGEPNYCSDRPAPHHDLIAPSMDFHANPCLPECPSSPFLLPPPPVPFHPGKACVAFSTYLSPHRNVKTHTFCQGQAFVQRDGGGGWRFTWVPSQTN